MDLKWETHDFLYAPVAPADNERSLMKQLLKREVCCNGLRPTVEIMHFVVSSAAMPRVHAQCVLAHLLRSPRMFTEES